ncbi:hypothetical protein KIW84_043835 [Lathyrus oleraceus]|uniref:DUF7745 domain-containing protein n=1 Tax=Pisum sativum TaxID=3888 RepID=A0A9D5APL9_PEA|nr:hypothetical protein KIW84_043835 [Pisum sativum]
MDYGRRNTKKYSFRCPDLKELRKLASFVLDPLAFKQPFVPTLEEYSHLLRIPISSRVPFSGLEEIPRSSIIVEALHLKKSEIEAHWVKKGGLFGFPFVFLIKEANTFAQAGSVDAFEAIFVNHVPTLLGDMYFSLHLRNSKGGGTIVYCIPLLYKWFISHLPQTPAFVENKQCLRWSQRLMSLTNDDIVWYDPSLSSLEIIDSYGEFSNVPLIGTQGGINYNPARKKIVDQLVLEKTQMKASFETETRRIRRKYAPLARSSDIVVKDP